MVTIVSGKNRQVSRDTLQEYERKKALLLDKISVLLRSNPNGISLQKDTSNLFRNRAQQKNRIDVRTFNKVIKVDEENLIAEIEGMTPYEEIVKETLKHNCLPAVVPELKSITIGGALAGIGIESSSFRYGLVHETILEYEVLTGSGRIVICRPDNEHKELYYAFPNTYGSLGYALKVKIKLIPAKKYVKLSHNRYSKSNDYFESLQRTCLNNRNSEHGIISYVEGVVFNSNEMYISIGEFVDEAPYVNDYKYKNIYYTSIRTKTSDCLSTEDYIWRWDPDWFWCSKHFLMQNKIMRSLFGKFMLKSTVYWKIRNFFNKNKIAKYFYNQFKGRTETIIQDIEIPISQAENFLNFFQSKIGIKPIWICPIMPYQNDKQYTFYKMDPNQLYINFGFWDIIPSDKGNGYYNKSIERKVQELGGNKSLYSNVYYTEEEFWNIYDKALYTQLKQKYDPKNNLKDLYTSCTI